MTMRGLLRVDRFLQRFETIVAAAGLLAMLGLFLAQILARNLFDTGFSGVDELLRYLVLIVSFAGGALAISRDRHISLDVVSPWISDRVNVQVRRYGSLFALIVCVLLAWAAARFWWSEWTFGSGARWLQLLGLVFPVSFSLFAFHFLIFALRADDDAD